MFPPERKPERGYVRMFPRNENRNEGTFAKTTLNYETAPLSPTDFPPGMHGRGTHSVRHDITKSPTFCVLSTFSIRILPGS